MRPSAERAETPPLLHPPKDARKPAVAATRNGQWHLLAGERADDPGAPDVLARYDRLRRGDVASRTLAVDTLNRALLTNFMPMDFLRGAGLFALQNIGPLRRLAMREGVMPGAGAPRVMRQRPADVVRT